jgi:hypothetical protein
MTKKAGSGSESGSESGSISQRYGPADSDPNTYQNVMDPQHWWVGIVFKLTTVTTGNNLTFFTLTLVIVRDYNRIMISANKSPLLPDTQSIYYSRPSSQWIKLK